MASQPSDRMRDVLELYLDSQPDTILPDGIRGDGAPEYGPLRDPEPIEGIDPATGKRDPRFDGTITAAAPLDLVAAALDPVPPPEGHPAYEGALMVPIPGQIGDLVIANDLDAAERIMGDAMHRYDDGRGFDPRRLRP